MGIFNGRTRESSVSCWIKLALVGLVIAVALRGANCDEGPTESQCRPYIEKALKEKHLDVEEKSDEETSPASGEISTEQEENPPTDELTDSTESSKPDETEDLKSEEDDVPDDGVSKEKDDDDGPSGEAEESAGDDEPSAEETSPKTEEETSGDEEDERKEGESLEEGEEKDGGASGEKPGSEENKEDESVEETEDAGDSAPDKTDVESKEDENEDDGESKEQEKAEESKEGEQPDEADETKEDQGESKEDDRKDGAEESGEETGSVENPEGEEESAEQKPSGEKDEGASGEDEKDDKESKEDEEEVKESKEKDEDDAPSKEDEEGADVGRSKEDEDDDGRSKEDEAAQSKEGDIKDSKEDDRETGESKEEQEQDEDDDDDKKTSGEAEESKEGKDEEEESKEAAADEGKSEEEAKQESGEAEESKEEKEKEESEETAKQAETASEEENATEEAASKEAEKSAEEEDEDQESTPEEEDLTKEVVIPENLRPRDHITKILRLDEDSLESESVLSKVIDSTLKTLKNLYDNAIKPLEMLYKYRDLSNRHFGDPEIFSKPLILFMGPWSGGKSSTINYLLDIEFSHMALRTGAEPSPAYFNILMHGKDEEILDGTQLAADWTFSGLQKFGQGLLDRLRGVKLNNRLLEKVNIVEIPGILEIRKQVQRLFPFNDACQWFIDRADIIFLVYDPAKLDVGPETEAILDQLKGREYQTRIILNKADQVKPEELMRVQGTLIWNISPLMSSTEPPIMYTTSLWSFPYEVTAPTRLLQAQERAFLRDLREAIDKRVENKIASARRFAVRVRNHAKMVDCYLTTYYNHKTFFGNRKKISDDIIENPQKYHIYEGLSTLTNISRYDLPDPDVYRDFFKINPLYDFTKLSDTCTYFRGCPINKLDVAIAYDLPELVGKYKKAVEAAKEQTQKTNS